jgi:hypothetical protein
MISLKKKEENEIDSMVSVINYWCTFRNRKRREWMDTLTFTLDGKESSYSSCSGLTT